MLFTKPWFFIPHVVQFLGSTSPIDRDPSIRIRFDGAVSTNVCHQGFFDRHTNADRVLRSGKKRAVTDGPLWIQAAHLTFQLVASSHNGIDEVNSLQTLAPAQTPTSTMALPTKKRGEMTSLANHAAMTIVITGNNK